MALPKLVSVEELCQATGLKKGSPYDPRIRARLKLPAVRIGKRMMFRESDVIALIERGTEKIPALPGNTCEEGGDE